MDDFERTSTSDLNHSEMPKKVIFILSTARTGTKTLAEGLSGNDILSPHQPPFSRLLNIASNQYLNGWLSIKILRWLVMKLREPQIINANCRFYIQVFSLDYLPAKIISERHENVSIIHIVRDPRTFVPSYLNWIHTRWKSFLANRVIPGWHPSGCRAGNIPRAEWIKMNEFQRVCWHWTYKNKLIEELFVGDQRYMRILFEDLFNLDNHDSLDDMLAFVGIPSEARFENITLQKKNRSQKAKISQWDEWSEECQKELIKLCGVKMREYGYLLEH